MAKKNTFSVKSQTSTFRKKLDINNGIIIRIVFKKPN